MVKKIILILIYIAFSLVSAAQSSGRKIAICSTLDSISDYVIWYTPVSGKIDIDKKYLFNQKTFILNEFGKRVSTAGYGIIYQDIPKEISGGFLTYFGKTKEEFGNWLSKLRSEQNVDYVILLKKLILPSDVTNFSMIDSFLQGEEFGIVTYYGKKKKVIVYSMVDSMIFNTTDLKLINYRSHEPFIKGWRKVIQFKEKVTENGFLVDDKIPLIKAELDSLFLNQINIISNVIINKQNAL